MRAGTYGRQVVCSVPVSWDSSVQAPVRSEVLRVPSAATNGFESGSLSGSIRNQVARASTDDSAARRRSRSGRCVSVPAAALTSSRSGPGRALEDDLPSARTPDEDKSQVDDRSTVTQPSMDEREQDCAPQQALAAELTRLHQMIERQESRITELERQLNSLNSERSPTATEQQTSRSEEVPAEKPSAVWLTVPQVAKHLGITTPAVRKRIRSGRLRAVDHRKPGRRNANYRVHRAELPGLSLSR